MSRSYKKNYLVSKDHGASRKIYKRMSSKFVRRIPLEDVSNGNQYKKNGYSYDICDYRSWINLKTHLGREMRWYLESIAALESGSKVYPWHRKWINSGMPTREKIEKKLRRK